MNKKQKVALVIALNLAIVALEVVYGVVANSVSLIADAVHNLGDVLAVFVTFVALTLGAQKASESMTFGFVRAEMMAGFVNAFFLLLSMGYILYESVLKLIHPEAVKAEYMIGIAAVALAANGVSAVILHRIGGEYAHAHRHEHAPHGSRDHHHHDFNIRSAYLHMLSDALISLGVVIGGVVISLFGIYTIDPILSILFSLFILKETVSILKHSFFSLMDINTDDLGPIEECILSFDNVHSIHDLHVHRPSSKEMYLTAHLVFDADLTLAEVETLLKEIRTKLRSMGITHSVLQPETMEMAQENILCSAHD